MNTNPKHFSVSVAGTHLPVGETEVSFYSAEQKKGTAGPME